MRDQSVSIETLTTGWQFKELSSQEWLPVKRVPTVVHLDLLDNEKIPDPYIDFNELDVQWVGETSWTYRIQLARLSPRDGFRRQLVFEGLDTFATVRLNGRVILKSSNMFIAQRVDVTDDLTGADVLEIEFESALLKARELMKEHPDHKYLCWNGEPARLTTRKAQYHWGWDWGPVLMTAGPWRPVRLETFVSRISDVRVDYEIDLKSRCVRGTVHVSVVGKVLERAEISVVVQRSGQEIFTSSAAVESGNGVAIAFELPDADLWYPHGYGKQTLYDFSACLKLGNTQIDKKSKKIGLRQVDLVQQADKIGKSFFFRINGIDVFCGGSNWIPADNFIPRMTEERYRRWIQMMVDGNQHMIRVWGGGIWEEDVFYDLCDELGVLVWQDFLFGCGNYPCWPELLESIEQEASVQVQRLRHHCSIVIYAGNNEDYQLQESYNLTYDYEDKSPDNWLKTDFPARYIYEKILPGVIAKESPSVPYHPGSPWGDGKITSDRTVGDMHQWNVWHGTQEKYQIFDTLGGRFNSEFGMEAFPHIDTIKYFCTDKSQLYPQSHVLDFHNKADGHERRIATYLVENFRTQTKLEPFIHLTQLVQSEALMFGYRGWRKRYGQDRLCGGALVWQLDDCWPVTSWAIVDYFQRKKPAYYALARVLAPIAVGVQREHHDWSVTHARPAKTSTFELWIVSSKQEEIVASVELRFISIRSGKEIKASVKKAVHIVPNGTTEVLNGVIDNVVEEPHVLATRVIVDGKVIARDIDWPQPLKYLSFKDRGVKVQSSGNLITISVCKPTKGLVFEEREGIRLSDSAIDLVPGDDIEVELKGLRDGDAVLRWTYLGEHD